MKKVLKTIALLSLPIFFIFGFVKISKATNPLLSVSPASLTKNSGDTFTLSITIDPSGSKVCAVEGTLVLNGLSFQSVTMSDSVMPQSMPSSSNPHFLIGIPGCITAPTALFTLVVKARNVDQASVGFTGVDIVGEGSSVGSSSTGGKYSIITSVPAPAPVTITTLPSKNTVKISTVPSNKNIQPVETTETPGELQTASVNTAGCNMIPYSISLILSLIVGFFLGRKTKILQNHL